MRNVIVADFWQHTAAMGTATLAACALALLTPGLAAAQQSIDYPKKPVRMIVSSPAGGGVDVVGRHVMERLSRNRGWSIVIDNRSGAAGNIATEMVANATKDGYTLLLTTNNHNMNAVIYRKPGYDPRKDFANVVQLTEAPSVLIAPANSPFRTLKDVIAAARAQPGKLVYGTSGSGTPTHAAGELLKKAAGIDILHIPYKGGALANQDVLAGQIPLGMAAMPAVMSNIQAGRLRAIVITFDKRWPSLPDVPTVAESGFPGFAHLTWIGLFAPVGTPSQIVTLLNRETAAVLASPDMRDRVLGLGASPVGKSSSDFDAMLKKDYDDCAKLAAQINLRVE